MPTNKNLSNLVINKIDSQAVFDYLKANNLLNEDELYLVQGSGEAVVIIKNWTSSDFGG